MDKRIKAGADLLTAEAYKPLLYEEAEGEAKKEAPPPMPLSERFEMLKNVTSNVIATGILPDEDLEAALAERANRKQ